MTVLKMLVYSPAGHGKTVFACSALGDSRLSPALLLDFEGGTSSIESKVREVKISDLDSVVPDPKKVDVIRITTWAEFEDVYEFLSETNLYKTIILDSLSEMNYLNLDTVVAEAVAKSTKHDPDIPELADYLRSAVQMRKLIRYFRDLPYHIIFTAIAAEKEDRRTKIMKTVPMLTGKLVEELPGLLETIAYLALVEEVKEKGEPPVVERLLVTEPTSRLTAKDRSEGALLGGEILNPTLPIVLDKLEKKGK